MAVLTIDPPDPLTLALAPPPDESPADRWAREQREAAARLTSEQIDAQIKAEKLAMKKKGKPVKILLLGQSESGKSTTVKNFQLAYAYSSFLEERLAWRAVIHWNLVHSVNIILDVLDKEMARSQPRSEPHSPRPSSPVLSRSLSPDRPSTAPSPSSPTSVPDRAPVLNAETEVDPDADIEGDAEDDEPTTPLAPSPSALSQSHRLLQARLAPLREVQRDLERVLGAATSDAPQYSGGAAPWARLDGPAQRPREFFVISRSGWKSALRRVRGASSRVSLGSRDEARVETASMEEAASQRRKPFKRGRPSSPFAFSNRLEDEGNFDEPEGEDKARRAAEVIAACASDMSALWADRGVQTVLVRRKMKTRLEDGPGFFLNDVTRVAAREYEPSDEDVVRARLRTMGVQEYRFKFERGQEAGREWIIYDVGGARSSRHAWYSYFDDINALIFLAPISCFDERLAEDRRVNRLQDSLLLWKAVCSAKLLQNVQMILFLNKCDLLQKKLSRGVRVVEYIPSYGDRPNEARSVAKCIYPCLFFYYFVLGLS
ncbi:hypothetical protein AcW1_003785 [Taiwanofungus camphoratus]|nr:hypothetical protein AcV5_003534 [Antrodia cinnamomea]KAI0940643.1 hypothetical protein AcW1_003785 [Antrodia cinnamomea]